ncbi:MAG: ribulokinase [Firmicutes bacterium]|nr:ribulokinase [Bacillota bacterium]
MGSKRFKCALGIDFGTLSARAVVVDVATGRELGTATCPYASGVITERLPGTDVALPPGFALQDPLDYLDALYSAVPRALAEAGVGGEQVIGIGVAFTSCTILPVRKDGSPLAADPAYRAEPYAWVQLWKHLRAQEEADRMTEAALEDGALSLDRYGNHISAQWLFPKVWHMLREAPAVYEAADRIMEAGDWIVWQLTGREVRSTSLAGYKALWSRERGYPPADFLRRLDPRLEGVVAEKVESPLAPVGTAAGVLAEETAQRLGLQAGIPVAAAAIDAHAAVLGAGVAEANQAVLVMGTSICHMVLAERFRPVEGIFGVVEGGIVPGLYAYESGQPALGDLLDWFVTHHAPAAYAREAERQGTSLYGYLEAKAAKLEGGSGLIALDWWNGNRSILDDARLSGLVLGYTLDTRPEHVYLALMESLAFGTRVILESYEAQDIRLERLVACGGVPHQSRLLMQVFADVAGRTIQVAPAQQATALGAAIYGAVAAGPERGGHRTVQEAVAAMTGAAQVEYVPDPGRRELYDKLYRHYMRLHDFFGREATELMIALRR